MPEHTIATFKAFHRLVPSIVKRLSEDRDLAVRAMANPVLAIEELGLDLAPEVAREVERRVRFSEERRSRLSAIETKLFEAAGERFDPESVEDIERVLFSRLKLRRPADITSLEPPPPPGLEAPRFAVKKIEARARKRASTRKAKAAPRFAVRRIEPPPRVDPLERLKGAHPVVDLLLQHRAITSVVPKLSSRAGYEAVKKNPRGVPVANIVVRLPGHVE